MKWGLVPSWAKDPSIGNKLINARAETVAEKPSCRKAFKQQRCLVLADGFYECKREGRILLGNSMYDGICSCKRTGNPTLL